MTAPAIRVLVADDQAMVREGLAALLDLEEDLEVVGTAGDGTEAIAETQRTSPDVVLMDVRMPGMDGIEATARLTTARSAARVLVLTTFDLDQYVYDAVRAGASGFLLKDAPRQRLAEAIRAVARGDMLVDPQVTRRLVERFATQHSLDDGRLSGLTARERDILVEVGRGLSNAEIADRLFIGEATVKTHLASVLRKQGLRDRVQAVVLAYETGLVRPGG